MSPAFVAAGHPVTADAAISTLAAGGNAFDAAVAAGLAAAVAEPCLSSLGGGGFLLARNAAGEEIVFDFFVDTPGRGAAVVVEPHFFPVTVQFPGSAQDFNVGWGSVAVPGCLAGYVHVHERLGRLELAAVVEPARRAAEEGIELNDWQAYLVDLLVPILTMSSEAAAVFAPTGRPLRAGDTIRNEALAAFIARVGTGEVRGFDEPATAAALVDHARDGDGLLTATDLSAYEVIEREPLAISYRGHRVLTNPPPSFGGELIALALRLLEAEGPLPRRGSGEWLGRHVEVMREVDRVRAAGEVSDRLRSTGGTTQVTVVDGEGNVASMTTSNGEGAGFMVPGTGVMLNNMLGEDDLHPAGFHTGLAGTRVASMMSPTVVLERDHCHLALGSGGSKRIRTAITLVISAVLDDGLALAEAVSAPRVHWDGAVAQLEPGFDPTAVRDLARTVPVNEWEVMNLYFGGVHAAGPTLGGAGDPRRGGVTRVRG